MYQASKFFTKITKFLSELFLKLVKNFALFLVQIGTQFHWDIKQT